MVRGQVASDHGWLGYCLDRFVPEGISQVSRRSEVGNTKRRSFNTRLSSGTSAGTFAVSAGPYKIYHAKTGTKNKPWHVFGTISKKGLENRSSRFEPENSWLSFSRGSCPPLMNFCPFHLTSLQKYFRTNIVAGEPQLFLKKIRA